MKIYDVTDIIYEGISVYKDKPEKQPKIKPSTTGYVTGTRLELDVYTGTQIDAPLHMMAGGKTFEPIPLDDLVGKCRVVDLTEVENGVSKEDLENLAL